MEFRCHISGLNEAGAWTFATAMDFYGVGGPDSDPVGPGALEALLRRMLPILDIDRALLRGRYTAAVALMERVGIPIDQPLLARLRAGWAALRASRVEGVDRHYGVFEGTRFREALWRDWVDERGISWPRTSSGGLALDDDTFRRMALIHPDEVGPIWELRKTLNKLRVNRLAVGRDGRNRTPLRPFASKTGRNQPSTSRFIFGGPAWIRGLIRPGPGMALAYVDYEQQEFGIAAALSGDPAMGEAYASGDPYLAFARQAGAVPHGATKESHREERERFKLCALGIQYGMGARSLAPLVGSEGRARELIAGHRAVYSRYWTWSRTVSREARATGVMRSAFGWTLNVRGHTKPGTIRNFPLQANGAEILRLACCFLVDRGIRVCAPVHDAVLIEAPIGDIDRTVVACQEAMAEASEIVLGGFSLRTEARVIPYPRRFMDERGRPFWEAIMGDGGTCDMGREGT